MLQVAFVGTFAARLEPAVRRHLTVPCEIMIASEADILPQLPEIDVLVTMVLSAEIGRAATRLKLVQVPGAGLDRIDCSALPARAVLVNAYIVIAMPATAETLACIGHREFGLMKPGAFLINVARAEIVDEEALYDALKNHAIAGAARSTSGIATRARLGLPPRRRGRFTNCRVC